MSQRTAVDDAWAIALNYLRTGWIHGEGVQLPCNLSAFVDQTDPFYFEYSRKSIYECD